MAFGVFKSDRILKAAAESDFSEECAPGLWTWEKKDVETQGRRPCEDGGKDRSDAVTSQGTPGATGSWKR